MFGILSIRFHFKLILRRKFLPRNRQQPVGNTNQPTKGLHWVSWQAVSQSGPDACVTWQRLDQCMRSFAGPEFKTNAKVICYDSKLLEMDRLFTQINYMIDLKNNWLSYNIFFIISGPELGRPLAVIKISAKNMEDFRGPDFVVRAGGGKSFESLGRSPTT